MAKSRRKPARKTASEENPNAPAGFCGYCGHPVWVSQPSVWLTLAPGSKRGKPGRVHADCHAKAQAALRRFIAGEVKAGNHSPRMSGRNCQQCGREVQSFTQKTLDGKMLGPCCAVWIPPITPADLDRMRHPDDRGKGANR